MRMYVWNPPSLSDYYDGMVCVIAENKAAAIKLATEHRYPKRIRANPRTRKEMKAWNAQVDVDRETYRKELSRLEPMVIKRGAVHIHGGG